MDNVQLNLSSYQLTVDATRFCSPGPTAIFERPPDCHRRTYRLGISRGVGRWRLSGVVSSSAGEQLGHLAKHAGILHLWGKSLVGAAIG